jgi:hypothetical protein
MNTATLAIAAAAAGFQAPATDAPPTAATPQPAIAAVERRDAASLDAALAALAARHPGLVARTTIGTSPRKLPIHLLTLSSDPATAAARPAMLLVAGMDGPRWSGTEAALVAAEAIAAEHPELLKEITLYVVPRGNPDAAEAFAVGPRRDHSADGAVHDNDRDGRVDEDAPRDLNGDGLITQLRASGTIFPWPAATAVADPAEPRLLRAPDAKAGQVPVYTTWTEGIDTDGDGRIAEDWPGGLDPERNFPHRWPEFEDEAGAYPLIAPEAKSLADFVMSHPNIFTATVLGRHDTVITLPDAKAKTPGGMPVMIDEEDAAAYGELAKAWKEVVGQKRAEGRDTAGSFVAWMNAQRGVPTVASTLWGRPDLPEPSEEEKAKSKDKDKDNEKNKERASAGKPADEEAAAWLAYSDRVRGGAGFVPWTRIEHPQVPNTEVGGWVAGFRENPPLEDVAPLGRKCAEFLVRAAGHRPRVELSKPVVTAVGPGLWRVEASLSNTGRLPTVMRGGRADTVTPAHVVRISVPVERVKSGRRSDIVHGIDPGELRRYSWIVAAPPDEEIAVELLFNGTTSTRFAFRDGAETQSGNGGSR